MVGMTIRRTRWLMKMVGSKLKYLASRICLTKMLRFPGSDYYQPGEGHFNPVHPLVLPSERQSRAGSVQADSLVAEYYAYSEPVVSATVLTNPVSTDTSARSSPDDDYKDANEINAGEIAQSGPNPWSNKISSGKIGNNSAGGDDSESEVGEESSFPLQAEEVTV
jgi:hypothetical protein